MKTKEQLDKWIRSAILKHPRQSEMSFYWKLYRLGAKDAKRKVK